MTEHKATLIGRIYDYVEMAFWASLLASVAVFAVFVAPGLPAAYQRSEAERLAAFEHECEFYCSKWGMQQGTRAYLACVSDLHQFRDALVTSSVANPSD
jgi:hypothetical protein